MRPARACCVCAPAQPGLRGKLARTSLFLPGFIVRNLLIFLLILGAIWWVRRALQKARNRAAGDPKKVAGPERMLACAQCGVNVPESEGVREGSDFYCCEAHRSLGDAGKGR